MLATGVLCQYLEQESTVNVKPVWGKYSGQLGSNFETLPGTFMWLAQ